MGVAGPAAAPPPGHGVARPPRRQERETLPRDPARGNDRRAPQTETRPPGDEGPWAWQGRLRVPAVRCGVTTARVAQEREGAPPEAGGGHVALSVSRRRSLAAATLFRSLPSGPLSSLHPSSVKQRPDEGEQEDEQPSRLGGSVSVVEEANEEEDQNPEDDVARDPPLREIEDPAHRSLP